MRRILALLLFCSVGAIPAGAVVNHNGDVYTSGDVANPGSGVVLADTGAITIGFINHAYFDLYMTLNATSAAMFEIGLYSNGNAALKTFKISVAGGASQVLSLKRIPVTDGQKLKILTASTVVLGTVNVMLNLHLAAGD